MAASSLQPDNGNLPPKLSRRAVETLHYLCQGNSEKEVAAALGISPHTVHAYVKQLHRAYDVTTRGELISRACQIRTAVLPQVESIKQGRQELPEFRDSEFELLLRRREAPTENQIERLAETHQSTARSTRKSARRLGSRDMADPGQQMLLVLAATRLAEMLLQVCQRLPAARSPRRTTKTPGRA